MADDVSAVVVHEVIIRPSYPVPYMYHTETGTKTADASLIKVYYGSEGAGLFEVYCTSGALARYHEAKNLPRKLYELVKQHAPETITEPLDEYQWALDGGFCTIEVGNYEKHDDGTPLVLTRIPARIETVTGDKIKLYGGLVFKKSAGLWLNSAALRLKLAPAMAGWWS